MDAAINGGKCSWPAALDVQHDLVFIGDAARACILLAEDGSTYGESWHLPGAGPLTGRAFIELVYQVTGSKPAASVLTKWMLTLAGLFNAGARELIELLYEFEEPLVLDGSKFATNFPQFVFTLIKQQCIKPLTGISNRLRRISNDKTYHTHEFLGRDVNLDGTSGRTNRAHYWHERRIGSRHDSIIRL